MVRSIVSVLLLCFVVQFAHGAQNNIDGVRIWPSPDNTRVVFDMKSAPEFTYFTLKNPLRLVIDLNNTSDTAKLSGIENSGDLIKKLRYSTPKNKSSARVVVELNRNTKPSLFAVTPDGAYGHRLVVDLPDSARRSRRQRYQRRHQLALSLLMILPVPETETLSSPSTPGMVVMTQVQLVRLVPMKSTSP